MTKIHELHESTISRLIEQALFEDIGFGDITTESIIPEDSLSTAHILANDDGVIAGLEVATLVYRYVDMQVSFSPLVNEGDDIKKGQTVVHIHGPARSIAQGKQTVLNFLMRMSGIASLTKQYVRAVEGTSAQITGTRDTIPTLRMIDHFGVKAGGGIVHFYGSDEEILITPEHADVVGGIVAAVEKSFRYKDQSSNPVPVSVEVRTFDELRDILKHTDKFRRIILFGFPPQVIQQAVDAIAGKTDIEVTGSVTPDTAREIAETGVRYIRVPELTHSPRAITFTYRIST